MSVSGSVASAPAQPAMISTAIVEETPLISAPFTPTVEVAQVPKEDNWSASGDEEGSQDGLDLPAIEEE